MCARDEPTGGPFVDRCVCAGITLAELLAIHRATGEGVRALADRTGCTTGCGLCEPYVHEALRTGRTRLELMPPGARRPT